MSFLDQEQSYKAANNYVEIFRTIARVCNKLAISHFPLMHFDMLLLCKLSRDCHWVNASSYARQTDHLFKTSERTTATSKSTPRITGDRSVSRRANYKRAPRQEATLDRRCTPAMLKRFRLLVYKMPVETRNAKIVSRKRNVLLGIYSLESKHHFFRSFLLRFKF